MYSMRYYSMLIMKLEVLCCIYEPRIQVLSLYQETSLRGFYDWCHSTSIFYPLSFKCPAHFTHIDRI